MSWTWLGLDVAGENVDEPPVEVPAFSSQADAETWLGEHWRDLAGGGIDSVALTEGDRTEYVMSLNPS